MFEVKLLKICRFLISCATILCLSTAATAQEAVQLSSEECDVIDAYNEHYTDHDFPFLVGHMANSSELCEIGINCEISLAKREKPFVLTTDGKIPVDLATLIAPNLLHTAEFLKAFAGLNFEIKQKVDRSDSRVHLILIEAGDVGIAYSSVHSKLLKGFIATDNLHCMGVNSVWKDASIEYSEVWIKTNIGEAALANCVKEEIYNAAGVPSDPIGEASLFSPTPFSGEKLEPPLYERFSVRDRIVMQLVYDERMKNGQSKADTERVASEIIKAQCG